MFKSKLLHDFLHYTDTMVERIQYYDPEGSGYRTTQEQQQPTCLRMDDGANGAKAFRRT